MLIAGGAVNPVPGQVLAERGKNIIIASNVIPTLQERMRWQRGQIAQSASSLVDIMLNEREIMEGEIILSRMHPVDVVIQPDVARFHVRQYESPRDHQSWRRSGAGPDALHSQTPRAAPTQNPERVIFAAMPACRVPVQ